MINLISSTWTRLTVTIFCLTIGLAGCGNSGPQRNHIQGRIVFEGQPVPKGMIRFTPDHTKGNTGPGAVASILNGTYQTEAGRGVIAGPHTIVILGFNGIEDERAVMPDGAPLFPPYTTHQDIGNRSSVVDFEVPPTKKR